MKGGPGDPEFDAKIRANWLQQMRELLPHLSEEEFNEVIAEFDKIRDEFVEALNRDK